VVNKEGYPTSAWGGRRRPTCGPVASVTRRERQAARARELGQRRSLGSAQSGTRGKERRAARGRKEGERWAAGCAGLGRIREEK
jgi:hypothetical protein